MRWGRHCPQVCGRAAEHPSPRLVMLSGTAPCNVWPCHETEECDGPAQGGRRHGRAAPASSTMPTARRGSPRTAGRTVRTPRHCCHSSASPTPQAVLLPALSPLPPLPFRCRPRERCHVPLLGGRAAARPGFVVRVGGGPGGPAFRRGHRGDDLPTRRGQHQVRACDNDSTRPHGRAEPKCPARVAAQHATAHHIYASMSV
eukprot:COSAG01_NODE_4507_length_4968_cov_3.195317_4_plen_201_part_00